jgi:hypothetical protein
VTQPGTNSVLHIPHGRGVRVGPVSSIPDVVTITDKNRRRNQGCRRLDRVQPVGVEGATT